MCLAQGHSTVTPVGSNPRPLGLQRLTPNPDYRCAQCMGNARPIGGRPQSEVQVGPDKLEMVASFCYLLVEAVK